MHDAFVALSCGTGLIGINTGNQNQTVLNVLIDPG